MWEGGRWQEPAALRGDLLGPRPSVTCAQGDVGGLLALSKVSGTGSQCVGLSGRREQRGDPREGQGWGLGRQGRIVATTDGPAPAPTWPESASPQFSSSTGAPKLGDVLSAALREEWEGDRRRQGKGELSSDRHHPPTRRGGLGGGDGRGECRARGNPLLLSPCFSPPPSLVGTGCAGWGCRGRAAGLGWVGWVGAPGSRGAARTG